MDVARWLRFIVPGAIFESAIVGLIYSMNALFTRQPFGHVPSFDTGVGAALTAASVPIGYCLSSILHSLKRPSLSWLVATMNDGELMKTINSPLWNEGLTDSQARSFLDADLHLSLGKSEYAAALGRARSLLDLSNGTATSLVAVGAGLVGAFAAGLISWIGSDDRSSREIEYLILYTAAWGAFAVLLWFDARKLNEICREFIVGIFKKVPHYEPVSDADSSPAPLRRSNRENSDESD